jgi:DNA invertase Pin-like site-specific DNA recombinase
MTRDKYRTALYARISHDPNGEEIGVDTQMDACYDLAGQLGWTVVDTFSDNDISAYDGSLRPDFERLLTAMKAGRVDAVLCWDITRLYRSIKDLERFIDIAEAARVSIKAVKAGELDLSTSAGRMMARILGSVARNESELKSERRVLANTRRASDGTWRRDQPRVFGYTQAGEVLEPEATAVAQAITDVLAGTSLRAIAKRWNAAELTTPKRKKRGGGEWNNHTVRRALIKPCYAGLRVYQGKVVGQGTWTPLIDKDTHDGLIAFLSDPSRRSHLSFERKHQGSGVYLCGVCGGRLYARDRPVYYRCKPGDREVDENGQKIDHVARKGEPLDAYITALVLGVLRRDDIASRLSPRPDLDVAALRARRIGIQSRLSDLAAMFARAEIDAEQLRRGTADLREQMAGIDKVLAQAAGTSPAIVFLDGDDDLETRWAALSPDLKGKVINELMTVTVMPAPRGGTKVFDPTYIQIEPKC